MGFVSKKKNLKDASLRQRDGESQMQWELRSMTNLLRDIRPAIQRACAFAWNAHAADNELDWKPRKSYQRMCP